MARLLSILATFLAVVVGVSVSVWTLHGRSQAAMGQAPTACEAPSGPNINVTPADIIDGAKHPELIPDSIAYRLFFITAAAPTNPSLNDKARERAYLRTAGVREENIPGASAVLAVFTARYGDLVTQQNESVLAANEAGSDPDYATFFSQLDQLVESTRKALEAEIGPADAKGLDSHVQREKRNMTLAKEAR